MIWYFLESLYLHHLHKEMDLMPFCCFIYFTIGSVPFSFRLDVQLVDSAIKLELEQLIKVATHFHPYLKTSLRITIEHRQIFTCFSRNTNVCNICTLYLVRNQKFAHCCIVLVSTAIANNSWRIYSPSQIVPANLRVQEY